MEENMKKYVLNNSAYVCKDLHIKLIYVLVISTQVD